MTPPCGVLYIYINIYIFKVSGYDEMVDIGHLRCPGLDRVGSTPTNRNKIYIYINIKRYLMVNNKGEVLMLVIRPKL